MTNIFQSGYSTGTPRRNDTHHWLGSEAIRPRGDGGNSTHTDAHTPRLAVSPDWHKAEKPCDYMVWGEEWDLDLRNVANADQQAADLCHGCPVLEQCLSAALEEEGSLVARNRYLVRGGMTPAARAQLAASQRECRHGHVGFMKPNSAGNMQCYECDRISSQRFYEKRKSA